MTDTIGFMLCPKLRFPEGYYYAYFPTLDLTTHGSEIEGAKKAALELVTLWVQEIGAYRKILKQAQPSEEDLQKL